ncbi:RNA polymerase subunit sigma-70 [Streptomyces sp. NPDC002588]|uniref:RNA polymerase subunit sigma-70 n=1 Tax=Streptomyces sp. NPDC002588 TaxID=3154419 RepID=UPI00331975C1
MRETRAVREARRAREFEAFVAGAGGRLLQSATLLTAEAPEDNPRARRLLTHALAHTYACWDRLRGEDPYNHARESLAVRFARGTWRRWHRHGGPLLAGPLAPLSPQQRLVVVLRLHEGVAEEQVGALLGLPANRVQTVCERATAALLHPPRGPAPARVTVKAAAS